MLNEGLPANLWINDFSELGANAVDVGFDSPRLRFASTRNPS